MMKSSILAVSVLVAQGLFGLSLAEFNPVSSARVTKEGDNQVRLRFRSAEWGAGLELKAEEGLDFSTARYLAVDVENLSKTRQSRLTLHVSAGVSASDSDDHATALYKKNRSVNTGIGLNPGEKGTMKLLLTHPEVYGAPADARGPYVIDTKHVTSVRFQMQWPYEDEIAGLADLRLSNLRLEGTPWKDRFVAPDRYVPFVDPYGQFKHEDWPFKVHSDKELADDLVSERARLTPAPAAWDSFGGWAKGPQLEATGSFRTEKVNGKWWLVTPEGHLFFSVGLDVTRIMTDITEAKKHPSWYEGEIPKDGKMAFTIWNLEKKFGKKDFASDYYDFVLKRFDCWGLNTIGNWSAPELGMRSKKPYVACVLERAKGVKRHPKYHLYDFKAPDFEEKMRGAIREKFATDESLRHAAKDPMCIGFFIDNELQFQKWIPEVGEVAAAPYLELYFRLCKEELATVAPGKLYLGSRFVGFRQPGVLWRTAAKYCDVVTVNAYANSVFNLSEKMFKKGQDKPILVGEFHFGCLDRGLFKPGLAPVWNQAERARSFTRFAEGCLQHPLIIGCHWFQYRDQPLLGRGDGEAYQIGFVDVVDRPYPEMTRAARKLGETLYEKRANGVWGGRTVTSLCGDGWTCDGEAVKVPHTWNAADGADGSARGEPPPMFGMSISPDSYIRKAAVYTRALPDPTPGMRQFVRFDGVSRKATVSINGKTAGSHIGAFTAFTVEATDLLRPSGNTMQVIADNRYDLDVAPLSADYTLMGGIYRKVEWIETPMTCIDPVTDGASGVELDVKTNGTVTARIRIDNFRSDPVQETQTVHIPYPVLWTPENPKLYTHTFRIASGDEVTVRFGFRTVEFREDGFYLNGVKRKLRGVNRHQDGGLCGWAAGSEEEARDFREIKALGADAVRLAHYPQSSHIYDLCDELGLLVWSEVPAINWLTDSEAFKANLKLQAHEMVAQHKNHPCVFAWGLFNEIYNNVPPEREQEGWMEAILSEVRDQLKRDDPTRPVVAASDRPQRKLLNSLSDQLAFNAYPGWYGDTTMRQDLDNWFAASGRKRLGIAEYGAGGNPFEHLDPLPVGRLDPGGPLHPEETQVKLHVQNYRAILAEPRLWGTFIWAMYDFAADARREGGKNGINDKGLVTRDRKLKKDVFSFYKANWSKDPVLHVCSRRATQTKNATVSVTGFSNVGPVTLVVNGKEVGVKKPDEVRTVEWKDVPLSLGVNRIELRAGALRSRRTLTRRPEGNGDD